MFRVHCPILRVHCPILRVPCQILRVHCQILRVHCQISEFSVTSTIFTQCWIICPRQTLATFVCNEVSLLSRAKIYLCAHWYCELYAVVPSCTRPYYLVQPCHGNVQSPLLRFVRVRIKYHREIHKSIKMPFSMSKASFSEIGRI